MYFIAKYSINWMVNIVYSNQYYSRKVEFDLIQYVFDQNQGLKRSKTSSLNLRESGILSSLISRT